jgi:hypothetical protein
MGMFDELQCHWPLPDGGPGADGQTKSLGCSLSRYTITASGRLLHADGSDTGFHGILHFHCPGPDHSLRRFEAKFTDGQLQHLMPAAQAQHDEDGLHLNPSTATARRDNPAETPR